MPRDRSRSRSPRRDRSRSPKRSRSPEENNYNADQGQPCEALLMGKWLPGRVQRIGRDGEVDLILDDGTELENVPEERLRMPKSQAIKRASSWDCLEALAKDNHLRRGKVGKEPKVTSTMKKDEVRGIEELLGKELVKGLQDAFAEADSMKEGELDVDDVLTAFTSLRRVASRKDILAWLRTRSSRVRTRRTLSFVEFVKCFAGIFHNPSLQSVANDVRERDPRTEPALFADENSIVSEWARTLGRKRLLELEQAFKRRAAPHSTNRGAIDVLGQVRSGVPARDARLVFRDCGYDVAPSRFAQCLRDSGVLPDDFLSFPEVVGAYHALFIKDGIMPSDDDQLGQTMSLLKPPGKAIEGADGCLRSLSEVASVIFAEQRWEGTPLQHAGLVRRLCVGRPSSVQEAVRKVRDAFEEADVDDEGQLGADEASRLLDAAGIKGLKELRDEVLRSFKGEKKDEGDTKKGKKGSPKKKKSKRDRSRSRSRSPKGKRDRSPEGPPPFSLAEFFANAGHLIEAAASADATVASAMAQLRLSHSPAEVRGAATYSAKLVQEALNGNAKSAGRVATDDPLYAAKLGKLRGGLELIQACGFNQRVVEGKPKREFLVAKDKTKLKGALKDIEEAFGEEVGCPSVQGTVREFQDSRMTEEDIRQALRLAKRLVENVLKTPGDQRVFRVRGTNAVVRRCLTRHEGGPRLLEAVGFKADGDDPKTATYALERRGLQQDKPEASKGSRAFSMHQLDKETKSFLHKALADVDDALKNYKEVEDTKGATGKKGAISAKEKLLAERAGVGREKKGKERAEAKGKAKAEGKNKKREPSELEKSLKGDKVREAQLQLCRKAFENLDVDGDDYITPRDLKVAFARDGREAFMIPAWIAQRDLDQDGAVSFDDFLHSVASSFAVPAKAKAKKGEDDTDDDAIASSLGVLRLSAKPKDVQDVVSYVQRCLGKVIEAPHEPKYWRISTKEKFARYAGGTALLQACGFSLEENGSVLALRDPEGRRWDSVPEEVLEKLKAAKQELEGRSKTLDLPAIPDIAAVSKAVDSLSGDPDAWSGAVELAVTYVKNVLQDPKDDKKRRIQATNQKFESTLKIVPGGLDLMTSLGFRENEPGVWTMSSGFDVPALQARLLELESCQGPLKDRASRKKASTEKKSKPLSKTTQKQVKKSKGAERSKSATRKSKTAPLKTAKKENVPVKPLDPKVESRLQEMEKLALTKKRELAEREKELLKTKKLADDLAKRLHEANSKKARAPPPKAPAKAAPAKKKAPAKKAPAKKGRATTTTRKGGDSGGPTEVSSTLSKAAQKGDTVLEIDNSHEWEIGSKAIIGSGDHQESKFVIGLGSIILSAPLERSYGAHTLVQMYTPSKDEREQFNKAQSILIVHSVLSDMIATAANEGERVVRGRQQQQRQDSRFIPRSVVVARPVFCAKDASLAGCSPSLGRLLVTERGLLKSYGEGFSLSDLCRLFDRVDPQGSGRASASSIEQGARDDSDIAAAFADLDGDHEVSFERDVLPRLWRGDSNELLERELPPSKSCDEASERKKLSERALRDLDLVFRGHMDASGRLPFANLPAAFADLEGRGPSQTERDIIQRTIESLTASGRDALSRDDFIDARARHLSDQNVPLINGFFTGGGVNGWRRACLVLLRKLYGKVQKQQAKVRRVDAAPGDLFVAECKKDDLMRRFLGLDVNGTSLRDTLSTIGQKDTYIRWRHVEALVYGELGTAQQKQDEVYRRGPLDLLRLDASRISPHDETAADLASSITNVKAELLEVLCDPIHSLVFALTSDGVLDAWDTTTCKRIGKAPFLCVSPETHPSEEERPLPRSLAKRMLSIYPRQQILYLDTAGRALYVNTSCGDRCMRVHELSGLSRIKRLKLALPKMRSFGKRGFWDAPDASGLMDPRWCSDGALDKFVAAPHEGVIVGSVVGDDRVYAFDLTSGDIRRVYCGHARDVNCTVSVPDLRLYATGSADATIRVWPAANKPLESRGLLALRAVVSAAVAQAGPRPGYRDGVVGCILEDLDLVEVIFEDDGSAELLPPKRLRAPPSDYRPDCEDDRPGRLKRGSNVTVRHGKRQLGLERLFEAWDARGCGAVPASHVAVGLQSLKELLIGSVDDDLLAQLEPDEAAYALAASSGNDGFVRLDTLEDLVLEESSKYVGAKRILQCEASVTALTYAPLSGLLASASADGAIKLWDPRGDCRGVVAFSQAPHVCATPGYYRALEDEWCAVESCGSREVQLKSAIAHNPWGDEAGDELLSNKRAKVQSTLLKTVSISLGAKESRIDASSEACRAARAIDDRAEEFVAYLFLLDDGDLIVSLTDSFDYRCVLLRNKDAALFETGDAGLKRAFQERHRMLRIAYCSSSKHTSTSTLLTAIKSVADAVDRPLLARARGGDGDTLQKLGLDLSLFCRAGQDPREDVTHVIRATRFDSSSAVCATTSSDTACELLAADVRLSDGKTTRRAVCCWALGRAAIGSRRERAGVRPKEKPAGQLAAHAALCGWRVKLHAIRGGLSDQCRGLIEASKAARVRDDAVAICARDVVLRPQRQARRVELAKAFREALGRPSTTREARAVRRFHATEAHRKAVAATGLAVPYASIVLQFLRESSDRFDATAFGLSDVPPKTGITLTDLLERADRSAAYALTPPAGLALTRPVTQPPSLLQTTKELPEFLPPAVELDAPKMEDAILASDLGSLLKDDCRRVAQAAQDRDMDGGWLAAWSRHQEASAWRDRLSLARKEALCAADPASRRVDAALLQLARDRCVEEVEEVRSEKLKPPENSNLQLKKEGRIRGEAGLCVFREARCSDRSDVLLCRVRSGTFSTSHIASSPSLAKCSSLVTQLTLAEELDALVFMDPGSRMVPLRSLLDDRGGLGTDGVLDGVGALWFGQILKAVGHCHAFGLLVRHLRSDVVLIDGHRGEACKLCLVDPVKLEDGVLTEDTTHLDASHSLTPPEVVIVHVQDNQIKPSCSGCSRHSYRVTEDAPTLTWDSWGLGVLAFELAAGDRPAPYGPQLSAFLSRRGCTEEDLREVARDFHYAPFHAPSPKRNHRAPQTSGLVDEGVKAGHALKALDGGSWPAAWVPQRRRRDATKIDEVREALESHSRLLTAHRSKRSTTSLADDILEGIEARNDEVLTEEAILAVLGDSFGFPLDKDGARALCRACENDPSLLVEEIEDALHATPPSPPGGVLLCCAMACLRPSPEERPLCRDLLAARWLDVSENAFDEAKRFVRGEAKPWAWLEHRVVGPLLDAELDVGRGEMRPQVAEKFVDACRAAERLAAGLPCDDRRSRRINEAVCDAMVNRHDVPHRVVDVALNLKRLEKLNGDAHEDCAAAAASLITKILVLADDPEAPAADHAEVACRAAAKALYGDAAFPVVESDELSEAFTRVAPGYLATVVHACRALARPGAGTTNRKAAATAFANVFRLEAEQDSAAKELADADCATLLLPLASDINNDVRTATLRCCLNACAAGFDSLSALRRDPDASAASVAKDPRVRLARAFCQAAWVACCARSARSQDSSEEEADVALEALSVMAAAGDDGLRHWGAGGALSALVHVLKNGDVKGVVRGRQDTAEAGGGTHRLLQPFPTKGTTTGRSAGARRALGLILRGDAHFKKVLLKAHPGVCGAGGGVY